MFSYWIFESIPARGPFLSEKGDQRTHVYLVNVSTWGLALGVLSLWLRMVGQTLEIIASSNLDLHVMFLEDVDC